MAVTSGLSGNEIYCLAQKGYKPGDLVVGNSVYSLGLLRSITGGINAMFGGEVEEFTSLVSEGREAAYCHLVNEAISRKAVGITGVSSEIIFHPNNVEFLSMGSAIYDNTATEKLEFTTSADGQELYVQLDAGYKPQCFAFGNVVYSVGLGRGLLGKLKTFRRGEIKEFSDMLNKTRHIALKRIIDNAWSRRANAVLGIKTSVLSFAGVTEMLMIGTASTNSVIHAAFPEEIVTSDMTNIEMWNMATLGFAPMKLLLGTSVYSLGLVGGISALLKSFVRGEISELTSLIFDARENAIGIIKDEAKSIGADDVVGIKTYVYQLGDGLIEFLAIGTAVKKIPEVKTELAQLPPQAIIADQSTFFDLADENSVSIDMNAGRMNIKSVALLIQVIVIVLVMVFTVVFHK
ncbi:MAG TPA: heavy metal-binding domain-containing protein [Gammaproteobacteria bacterium]|nr:heavy metal-binding domain-containing protein [Gammaproteobacteria bacterium]